MLPFFVGTENLDELVSALTERVDVPNGEHPTILVCFMLVQILLALRVLNVFSIILTFPYL